MAVVSKTDLIDLVAEKAGLTKKDVKESFEATIATIIEALREGDEVSLTGFGTFKVSQRAAREGRNPKTGEKIKIAASKNAHFKAGKAVKDVLNG